MRLSVKFLVILLVATGCRGDDLSVKVIGVVDGDTIKNAAGAGMTGLGIVLATKVHPALGAIIAVITAISLSIQEFQKPGSLAAAFDVLFGIEDAAINASKFRAFNDKWIGDVEKFVGDLAASYIRGSKVVGVAVAEVRKSIINGFTFAVDSFTKGAELAIEGLKNSLITPLMEFGKTISDALINSINQRISNFVAIGNMIAGGIFIGFRDFFITLFDIGKIIIDTITSSLASIFEVGGTIGENLVEGIKSTFNLDGLLDGAEEGGTDILGGIRDFFSNILEGVPEAFGELTNEAKNVKDKLKAQDISVTLAKVKTDKLSIATEVLSKSDDMLTEATDKISQFYNDPFTKELEFNKEGLNINTNELQLLQSAFSGLRQAVRNLEAKIAKTRIKFERNDEGQITGFKLVGGISKSEISNLAATAFAHGGIVTKPTLGLVGEAGSEAIIPLSKLDKILSNGNGRSITIQNDITIEGGGNIDPEQLIERITDRILDEVTRKIDLK